MKVASAAQSLYDGSDKGKSTIDVHRQPLPAITASATYRKISTYASVLRVTNVDHDEFNENEESNSKNLSNEADACNIIGVQCTARLAFQVSGLHQQACDEVIRSC
jgi:hypothetical protein